MPPLAGLSAVNPRVVAIQEFGVPALGSAGPLSPYVYRRDRTGQFVGARANEHRVAEHAVLSNHHATHLDHPPNEGSGRRFGPKCCPLIVGEAGAHIASRGRDDAQPTGVLARALAESGNWHVVGL